MQGDYFPRNTMTLETNRDNQSHCHWLITGVTLDAYLGEAKMPEDRLLVIPAERLTFTPYSGRKVLVNIDFPSDRLGLAPGLHLAVEFTSAEARSVARALLRAADETEAPKRAASPLYC